jgi:hypothetical protein
MTDSPQQSHQIVLAWRDNVWQSGPQAFEQRADGMRGSQWMRFARSAVSGFQGIGKAPSKHQGFTSKSVADIIHRKREKEEMEAGLFTKKSVVGSSGEMKKRRGREVKELAGRYSLRPRS